MRVRLPRIDAADLNLFAFDFDITYMVFFLNADEQIYGRFGGRDGEGAETRMSLRGLHHAMEGALDTHAKAASGDLRPPLAAKPEPKFIRDVGAGPRFGRGGCLHCHQVKERLNAELERSGKWNRDMIWRYPLPDSLGLVLEVDRGNVIDRVEPESPAAKLGLKKGDVVERLHGLPVRSFGDAQYALDLAPKTGELEITWRRGDKTQDGKLTLPDGWRRTDLSWRPSMQRYVPAVRLFGTDLPAKDKEALGLTAKQLAFRQSDGLHAQARDAGVQAGDIILGVDGKKLDMDETNFHYYIRRNYIRGDKVTVNLLRKGERLNLAMTLR